MSIIFLYVNYFWHYKIIFNFFGDLVETPEYKRRCDQRFSICHWNLSSNSVHNSIKLSLSSGYLSAHTCAVIGYLSAHTCSVIGYLSAHTCAVIGYLSAHTCAVIDTSETYFDSDTSNDYVNLEILSYH